MVECSTRPNELISIKPTVLKIYRITVSHIVDVLILDILNLSSSINDIEHDDMAIYFY